MSFTKKVLKPVRRFSLRIYNEAESSDWGRHSFLTACDDSEPCTINRRSFLHRKEDMRLHTMAQLEIGPLAYSGAMASVESVAWWLGKP